MIERLERKYTNQMVICDEESGEEDNDSNDSNMGSGKGDEKEKEKEKGKDDSKLVKRKRRSNQYDAYDFDGERTHYKTI